MSKKYFFSAITVLIALVLQSCNLPGSGAPTEATVDPLLAAAMTMTALAEQSTPTSAPPTLTVSSTFTSTPEFTPTPAFTSTPSFPFVTLSEATNCRTGPDVVFDLVDTFQVGQTIQVSGKHPSANYWFVQSPNNPNVYCWMWGAYATGANLGNVPAVTPPPTLTPAPTSTSTLAPLVISTVVIPTNSGTKPSFFPTYENSGKCLAWWSRIKIQNVGSVTIKSISVTIKDTVTNESRSASTNGFQDINGCALSALKTSLASTEIATVVTPSLNADPAGHKVTVTITGCTEINLGGACSSAVVEFTP